MFRHLYTIQQQQQEDMEWAKMLFVVCQINYVQDHNRYRK